MKESVRCFVTPAQAGVQKRRERGWIPASAGMTESSAVVQLAI